MESSAITSSTSDTKNGVYYADNYTTPPNKNWTDLYYPELNEENSSIELFYDCISKIYKDADGGYYVIVDMEGKKIKCSVADNNSIDANSHRYIAFTCAVRLDTTLLSNVVNEEGAEPNDLPVAIATSPARIILSRPSVNNVTNLVVSALKGCNYESITNIDSNGINVRGYLQALKRTSPTSTYSTFSMYAKDTKWGRAFNISRYLLISGGQQNDIAYYNKPVLVSDDYNFDVELLQTTLRLSCIGAPNIVVGYPLQADEYISDYPYKMRGSSELIASATGFYSNNQLQYFTDAPTVVSTVNALYEEYPFKPVGASIFGDTADILGLIMDRRESPDNILKWICSVSGIHVTNTETPCTLFPGQPLATYSEYIIALPTGKLG
jgi:hypothetical protein